MGDIKFSITVDSTGAVKAVKDFEGAIDGTGKASEAAQPKMTGLWKEILGANFAYDLAKQAGRAFVDLIGESIGNAVEDQKSQHELAEAIRQTGRSYEIVGPALEAFAANMERDTLYTDEQVRSASALMVQMTDLDARGIQRAVRGAAGLATVMKIDLESASRLVMKAMEGNYGALSRYGIKVDETLTAEQKQAALLNQLEGLYGRAGAATQSFSGQVVQLRKAWENTKEEFGRVVLNTNLMQAGTQILTGALETLQQGIKGAKGQLRELALAKKADIDANAAAYESLVKMADSLGWSHAKLYLLTQQYSLNYGQLREWIQGNMFGLAAADALAAAEGRLAAAQTEYFSTLRVLGIPTLKEEAKAEGERQKKLADLKLALADGIISQDQYAKGIKDLSEQQKEAAKAISRTADEIRDLALAKFRAKKSTEELLRPGKELIEQQKEFKKTLGELGALELDHSEDKLPRLADSIDDLEVEYLDAAAAVAQLAEYSNALTPPEIKSWQDWGADVQGIIQNTFSALNTLIGGMVSISQQSLSNTLASLDAEYQARLKYIDQTITDETLRAEAIAALDAEFEKKKLDAKREAARKQKALDVAQAISGVAQAAIAALQVKPFFPLGLAMAAVATAMGAAQVAMIQQQPIPLASGAVFSEPTELFTGGRRYVAGEKGLEVMATEETLRRIVRDEVRGGGSGRAGGGAYGRPIALTVPIYIGTKKIKEEIISISQEGLDLGRLAIRGRNVRPS